MSTLAIQAGCSESTTVGFLPANGEGHAVALQTAEYKHQTLVERIAAELRRSLLSLRQRVRAVSPGSGTVVLMTSFGRSMGCTTTALAFALAARDECRTVLVDGDVETRGLSAALQPPPQVGWEDSIREVTRLNRAILEFSHWPGLAILPVRTADPESAALAHGPRLSRLLADLRREYDLIVVDGGTARGSGNLWGPWVDAALLVGDASQSRCNEWASAWDILEQRGANVLGMIETFV